MSSTVNQALALATGKDVCKLSLTFNGKEIEAEQKVVKDEVTSPPNLKISGIGEGPYLVLCVDLDAPFVTVPFLSPILHWIQYGLKLTTTGTLETQKPCLVSWLAPTPPPLSGPHRYLFILYEEPTDFDEAKLEATFEKPVGLWKRVRWNIDEFTKLAGLHEMVAATYFDSA